MFKILTFLTFLLVSCGKTTGMDNPPSETLRDQSPAIETSTQSNVLIPIDAQHPIHTAQSSPPRQVIMAEPTPNRPNIGQRTSIDTHYFVTLFGIESPKINFPAASHTWGTFVAVRNGHILEELTISWLPAPRYLRRNNSLPRIGAVAGKNYTLDETVALYPEHKYIVHGSFETTSELFNRAKNRIAYLNSGEVTYKALILSEKDRDLSVRNLPGAHTECIHAISDIAGKVRTGIDHGNNATRDVMNHFSEQKFIIGDLRSPNLDILALMSLRERLPEFKIEVADF